MLLPPFACCNRYGFWPLIAGICCYPPFDCWGLTFACYPLVGICESPFCLLLQVWVLLVIPLITGLTLACFWYGSVVCFVGICWALTLADCCIIYYLLMLVCSNMSLFIARHWPLFAGICCFVGILPLLARFCCPPYACIIYISIRVYDKNIPPLSTPLLLLFHCEVHVCEWWA